MDSRLNVELIKLRNAELRASSERHRAVRRWPDDGRPPRRRPRPRAGLHPVAVLASRLNRT